MSALISYARALAADHRRAQPIAAVRHVHVSDRPLVFVPLALAGEANAPLAAIVGTDRDAPTVLTVAEPRDRDQRFAFVGEPSLVGPSVPLSGASGMKLRDRRGGGRV